MSAQLRHGLVLAARSRAVLAPLFAWAFVLAGVYAYRPNEVHESFGVTALVLVAVSAWLAVAVSHAEPAPQRDLLAAARGQSAAAALAGSAVLAAALGTAAGATGIAFPALTGAFDRALTTGDVLTGAAAHAGAAAYGAALGTAAGARLVHRPATAFGALTAAAVLAVPLFQLAPVLSPAAWTADALLSDDVSVAAPAIAALAHAAAIIAAAVAALRRAA